MSKLQIPKGIAAYFMEMLDDMPRIESYTKAIHAMVSDFVATEHRHVELAVDVGTGTGWLAILLVLTKQVQHVLAVDTNKTMLRVAKKNAQAMLGSDARRITFVPINPNEEVLPEQVRGVDVIVSEILGTLINTEDASNPRDVHGTLCPPVGSDVHGAGMTYNAPVYKFTMPETCHNALITDLQACIAHKDTPPQTL